jgi:flagellar motor switch protein FliN
MTSDAPPDTLVGAYVQALLTACGTTLSTLAKLAVTFELEPPLRTSCDLLAETLPLPWLVGYGRFTRGLTGVHDLVLSQGDVPALARLLLGEPAAEAEPLTTEQADRIHDLVSRTLASVSASLQGFFGRPVALMLAEHQRVDSAEAFHPHAVDVAVALGRIVVDGTPRARFALAVPPSIAPPVEAASSLAGDGAEAAAGSAAVPGLDVILDISMPLTVELGRTKMLIRDILALGPGSVIELDKLAGEPVELLVNDRPIARGEVVVIDESFGVRLTHISHAAERLRSLS